MPVASNIWEYYKNQGQTLPTIEQRRKTFGLGSGYTGTAAQNQALLSRIQGPGQGMAAGATPTSPGATTTPPAAPGASPAASPLAQGALDWRSQMGEMEQYRSGLMGELGIPGLTSTVQGLRGQVADTERLLSKLRPDIEARTKDFLVTEAQRRRMEAVERRPLAEQLSDLTRSLGVGEAGLSSAMGQVDWRSNLASSLMGEERQFAREKEMVEFKDKFKDAPKGTQSDRDTAQATDSLIKAIEDGEVLERLVRMFEGDIPLYVIIEEYNKFHSQPGGWGKPQESPKEIASWTKTWKPTSDDGDYQFGQGTPTPTPTP
tara:strand:- start:1304 stop:2257 length:954 start_codon:yes stop_codon:yes gene_type:complete